MARCQLQKYVEECFPFKIMSTQYCLVKLMDRNFPFQLGMFLNQTYDIALDIPEVDLM